MTRNPAAPFARHHAYYPEAVQVGRQILTRTGDVEAAIRALEWKVRRLTCNADAITCWRRAVAYAAGNAPGYWLNEE